MFPHKKKLAEIYGALFLNCPDNVCHVFRLSSYFQTLFAYLMEFYPPKYRHLLQPLSPITSVTVFSNGNKSLSRNANWIFYGWFLKGFFTPFHSIISIINYFSIFIEKLLKNVYSTFWFFKTNIRRKHNFFTTNSCNDKMEWLIVSEIWGSIKV